MKNISEILELTDITYADEKFDGENAWPRSAHHSSGMAEGHWQGRVRKSRKKQRQRKAPEQMANDKASIH